MQGFQGPLNNYTERQLFLYPFLPSFSLKVESSVSIFDLLSFQRYSTTTTTSASVSLAVREVSQQLEGGQFKSWVRCKDCLEVCWQQERCWYQILDPIAWICALEQGTQPPTTTAPRVPSVAAPCISPNTCMCVFRRGWVESRSHISV